MAYDPCNPPKIIHHRAIGRFKHHYRHHGGVHNPAHPYHHIVTNGCPKVSVLDIARFGPIPGAATVAKLAPIGGLIVAGGVAAGAIAGYQGGYFGGGGYVGGYSGGGTGFVCTKYTQHDKRCEHVVQVAEPSSILCLLVGVVVIFLSRKRLLSI